jgi:hypothetical protein
MNELKSMLFSLQRFQILALFTNASAKNNVSPSYAFAWAESVYPCLNGSAEWHKPYEECFSVREIQISELHNLLVDRWEKKDPITFYELEKRYVRDARGAWDRSKLLSACQYIHLCKQFDSEFWAGMLKDCPIEAHSIIKDYQVSDVSF